jgi:hypothetical protein
MRELSGANVQMALMSQVFLPETHLGLSKRPWSVLFVRRISLPFISKR